MVSDSSSPSSATTRGVPSVLVSERLYAVANVLRPCRFSFLAWGLGTVVLWFVPQATDVLRVACGRDQPAEAAILVLATAVWGFASWYFARVMLQLQLSLPVKPELRRIDDWLVRWAPRAAGALTFATVMVALVLCARGSDADGRRVAWELAGVTLLAGLAFFAFVTYRRDLFRLEDVRAAARKAPTLRALSPTTRKAIGVFAAIHLAFVVLFSAAPVAVGQALGAAAVVVFALATWVALGTAATYAGLRWHFPPFLALALLAVLASRCNDDHAAAPRPVVESRPELESDFDAWSAARGGVSGPIVLVATEGGGVRAAYWTGLVLSYLADRVDGFRDHLYAVSSVSGGSIGSAAFFALLVEDGDARGDTGLEKRARAALSVDAVAPLLGKLLYPDLLQQIIPFPVPWFGRSAALESSWAAPFESRGDFLLTDSIGSIWQKNPKQPRLFLNATWLEPGERTVFSWPRLTGVCQECEDGEALGDFGLLAAAHDSARFPYVSPPSTIERGGETWGHLADGGYFDNSGASTVQDVADALRERRGVDVRVIVIRYLDEFHRANEPERWLVEERTPFSGLLHVRDARGKLSVRTLAAWLDEAWPHDAKGAHMTEVTLTPPGFELPLGWTLSEASQSWMESRLDACVPDGDGQVQGPAFRAANVVRGWLAEEPARADCPPPPARGPRAGR